ncbi:hypothetical protein [Vibrio vulnificus YJ016]|uniref:Uncharacterized protein n=1 Tax=Vibrio vulnificus (strain YJ016) TaxID=196600 RepID=Q7MG98_VIBVY|nr:hypothetical protein [Vibrio vulnificus YJ016]
MPKPTQNNPDLNQFKAESPLRFFIANAQFSTAVAVFQMECGRIASRFFQLQK